MPALGVARVRGGAGRLLALQPSVGGGELVLALAAQMPQLRARRTGGLNVVLEGRRVAGHVALQRTEPVEGDGQGGDTEHHAGHPPHGREVAAQGAPRGRGPLRHQRQHEEGHGDARRVEQGDEQRCRAHPVMGGGHRDGREHRPGAGHEDEPEAQPEDEAATLGRVAGCAEPGERPLNELAHPGDEEPDRQQAEHGHTEPEQQVLGEMEEAEDGRREEDRQAEAHDHAGDDHVGTGLARARRPAGHHDGDDRDDAGGEARDQPAEERDDEQLSHGNCSRAAGRSAPALLRGTFPLPRKLAGDPPAGASPARA